MSQKSVRYPNLPQAEFGTENICLPVFVFQTLKPPCGAAPAASNPEADRA